MANKIKVLEDAIIDQIAAGEVVDRPAHMVKELCENSLDAGATEITVDFKNGGRDVLVQDNGDGMDREDLRLSLARHATSKIIATDDLWQISSYGFRGEALASIGAVSRLQLISRPQEASLGAQIQNEFGQISDMVEVGAEKGTTVIVRDLFQNVPARLKFLKTDAGESTAIKNQMRALALANPEVSIRVLQDGQLIFFWPSVKGHKERVQQVLEQPEMYEGEARLEGFAAHVVVSSPNQTLGHSRQIWLFVRGRYVQDRSLQTAVLEAYRHLLMHGEYPIAVVYLDCDPEDVDVNVSPTKSQVKFREPGLAFRVVQRAVRSTLELAPWLQQVLSRPTVGFQSSAPVNSEARPNMTFSSQEVHRVQHRVKDSEPGFSLNSVRESLQSLDSVDGSSFADSQPRAVETGQAQWGRLEVIGQAHLTYIVTQKEDAILFVDQHAAHERVMFEKLMADYRGKRVEVQNFLLPPVVKLTEDVVNEILKNQLELEGMGLYLDQMGPDELAIRGAPAIVKAEALVPMLEMLGEEYADKGGSFQLEKTVSNLMATMACHSAVRAGQALSLHEIKALLQQMDEYPLSSFCPHGRPVYVEYPLRKLERDFGRLV